MATPSEIGILLLAILLCSPSSKLIQRYRRMEASIPFFWIVSAKSKKNTGFFGIALNLHYLCNLLMKSSWKKEKSTQF